MCQDRSAESNFGHLLLAAARTWEPGENDAPTDRSQDPRSPADGWAAARACFREGPKLITWPAMIYGKKGLEIKPFASDDPAASSSRMVSSAITLIRSSMCSASASVFGFLASTYLAIVLP